MSHAAAKRLMTASPFTDHLHDDWVQGACARRPGGGYTAPMPPKPSPLRIRLTPERRAALLESLIALYGSEFDETLSAFRADALLDFFVHELGPPVYNQGVRDAAAFMQAKLGDIEGDVYERE